jgi:fructose-1-phosphate kinase PfkB-like protein
VLAAGFCGGATGELLRELLLADGLEPLLVRTAARTRIGFELSGPEGGTALLEDGFPVGREEAERLLEVVRGALAGVELVLIGGSVPDPSCVDLYRQMLEACAEAGVPCWLDSYGPPLRRALANPHPPQLAKPNRQEYGDGQGFESCPEIHLTDGPRAIEVRSLEGLFRVTPPSIEERSGIGSGDCYLAALAHARLSGSSFDEQLRYAAAAGAANAALGATGRIGPRDIAPLVRQVVVERHKARET